MHFTGPSWPPTAPTLARPPHGCRRHKPMVLSAEPVHTRSPATHMHNTAMACAFTSHARLHRAPCRSHPRTCPSEPAAYTRRPVAPASPLAATAFHETPWRATRTARRVCAPAPALPLSHALTRPSAEAEYTTPQSAATALMASSWARTDSRHRRSDMRHTLSVRSQEPE
ncbi:hypothetical protein VPH35_055813 [Triticum aestivum]